MAVRIRAGVRGVLTALASEPRLVERLLADSARHPVEEWRRVAPQLEASLWPLFVSRTRHLANAAALALNEPQPLPRTLLARQSPRVPELAWSEA